MLLLRPTPRRATGDLADLLGAPSRGWDSASWERTIASTAESGKSDAAARTRASSTGSYTQSLRSSPQVGRALLPCPRRERPPRRSRPLLRGGRRRHSPNSRSREARTSCGFDPRLLKKARVEVVAGFDTAGPA